MTQASGGAQHCEGEKVGRSPDNASSGRILLGCCLAGIMNCFFLNQEVFIILNKRGSPSVIVSSILVPEALQAAFTVTERGSSVSFGLSFFQVIPFLLLLLLMTMMMMMMIIIIIMMIIFTRLEI